MHLRLSFGSPILDAGRCPLICGMSLHVPRRIAPSDGWAVGASDSTEGRLLAGCSGMQHALAACIRRLFTYR